MSEDLSRYNNSRAEKDLAAIISNDESLLDKIPKSRMEELLIMLYNKCEEQDNKITELNGKLHDKIGELKLIPFEFYLSLPVGLTQLQVQLPTDITKINTISAMYGNIALPMGSASGNDYPMSLSCNLSEKTKILTLNLQAVSAWTYKYYFRGIIFCQ